MFRQTLVVSLKGQARMRKTFAFFGWLALISTVLLTLYLTLSLLFQPRLTGAEYQELSERLIRWEESSRFEQEQRLSTERKLFLMVRATDVPWTESSDRKVRAKLAIQSEQINRGSPIWVLAQIQNISQGPLLLERPADVALKHAGHAVNYEGPTPDVAPTPPPVQLQPNEVHYTFIEYTPSDYPALANTQGLFAAEFRYRSSTTGEYGWTGEIGPLSAQWLNRDLRGSSR